MKKKIPSEIIQKLRNLQMMSNKIRFLILVALYNSYVLRYKETFTELLNILSLNKTDLVYHLGLLLKCELVAKKENYYTVSKEGIRLMNVFGLTEKKVKKIAKAMGGIKNE